MTSTTTSVSMRYPGSGVGGLQVQGQTVDVADQRLGTRLDRAVIDVAGCPGGASIVDAAGLAGLETHGHADTIARCDGCFHLPAPAPHPSAPSLSGCQPRVERRRG